MAKKSAKPSPKAKAKAPAKKPEPKAKPAAKAPAKAPAAAKPLAKDLAANEQRIKHALKKLTGGGKNTPTIFKLPTKKATPMVFSLSEVRDLIKEKAKKSPEEEAAAQAIIARKAAAAKVAQMEVDHKPRVLKSATLDDLLGGGKKNKPAMEFDESKVPMKWSGYYKKLKALRDRLAQSVEDRSEQTLRTSGKEAAGDLSSYGQHIADAGTDAFDTDFALSLVSSDQEMLREVEAAIARIFNGTYGVCEVTHKPISRDRLNAVPWTRFSKEGQDQWERTRRKSAQRVGISTTDEDEDGVSAPGGDDDGEQ